MTIDYLPSIFVPLVGLVLPLFSIIFLFLFIENEEQEVFNASKF